MFLVVCNDSLMKCVVPDGSQKMNTILHIYFYIILYHSTGEFISDWSGLSVFN